MRKIFSFLFACSFFLFSNGQNAVLMGVINDQKGEPLPYASVYLDNGKIGTLSDPDGNFMIPNISPGVYIIHASVIGFEDKQLPITITTEGTYKVNFELAERLTLLSEVTIISGGEAGVSEIAGSVHYISAREMRKFKYSDINRILSSVPGVNIQEEDGFGLRPNIGLRGSGSERSSKITIMEDGLLMAPAPYSAPSAYYFPSAGRMEGVEIMKGSSQIKYGPYTTGGAINLISTSIPDDLSGKIDLSTGSFGNRKLHAFGGSSHKHISYSLETYLQGSEGFKELDNGNSTGFNKNDYLGKIKIHSAKDAKIYQSVYLKLGRSKENSNETYLGLTDEDFLETPNRRYAASAKDVMNTTQNQYSLSHYVKFSPKFEITTTAYGTDFKRNWYKLDKVADDNGQVFGISSILAEPENHQSAYSILIGESQTDQHALFVKANNRSYKTRGIQMITAIDLSMGQIKHHVDLGIRYHSDQVDRFQWVDEYSIVDGSMEIREEGTPGTESNRIASANAIAAFASYTLKYGKLKVMPGLRFESIEMKRTDYGKNDPIREGGDISNSENHMNVLIPGISIDYKFNRSISSFIGVHKGFAPAGPAEGAKAEQNLNYEAGVRYNKSAVKSKLILFYSDYSNLLGADLASSGGSGSGDLFNGGEADVKGIEFEISYDVLYSSNKAGLHLPLKLAYTFTDAQFKNSFESEFEAWGEVKEGDKLPYLAGNQFSVSAGLESYRFRFIISSKYVSAMRTQAGQGKIQESESTDSYFVTDLSAHFRVHRNIDLYGTIQNLANASYIVSRRPAGVRPGMPRSFMVGVSLNL
ncbi:MAG: TonB-dependent receptor [Chitinophagales bacterium]|nr:TonB-dependent receptor [Chitinophagales bacterium]